MSYVYATGTGALSAMNAVTWKASGGTVYVRRGLFLGKEVGQPQGRDGALLRVLQLLPRPHYVDGCDPLGRSTEAEDDASDGSGADGSRVERGGVAESNRGVNHRGPGIPLPRPVSSG